MIVVFCVFRWEQNEICYSLREKALKINNYQYEIIYLCRVLVVVLRIFKVIRVFSDWTSSNLTLYQMHWFILKDRVILSYLHTFIQTIESNSLTETHF